MRASARRSRPRREPRRAARARVAPRDRDIRAPGRRVRAWRGRPLYDENGDEYLDFLCGISVTNLGHCHPDVVAAVRDQVGRLMHVSNLFYTEPAMRLAAELSAVQPRREGLLLQLGSRGQRGRDQARPPRAPRRRDRRLARRLPRPDLWRLVGDPAGEQAGAVRAAGTRLSRGTARPGCAA